MVDSHTHLFLCERGEDELVAAALDAGVERMLNVGLGERNETAVAAAERHPAVFASVGCHPTEADSFDDALAAQIDRLAAHERVRAVGETGIDYYHETAGPEAQRRAFETQVAIAREHDLPIVIHGRDKDGETAAIDEIFTLLDQHAVERAMRRLDRDIETGEWHERHHDLLALDAFDAGYRLVAARNT